MAKKLGNEGPGSVTVGSLLTLQRIAFKMRFQGVEADVISYGYRQR